MATSKHGFTVEILEFEEVHSLPGRWGPEPLRELLAAFEYDDIAEIGDADLAEMAAMAAQDMGVREAADELLLVVFGDAMSAGVRQNLIDDLTQERPWEQFVDLAGQSRIFDVVEFLQQAFPNEFGIPDAARVRVRVTASDEHAARWLRAGPQPALAVRLLADAMGERATLRRLYGEQIDASPFRDAESILWSLSRIEDRLDQDPASCVIEVHSSLQWFGPLREVDGPQPSDAKPDD